MRGGGGDRSSFNTPMSTKRASIMTPMGGGFADSVSDMAVPNLAAFKSIHKIDQDLFDQLFSVPTDLQKSLVVPPEKRSKNDVANIARVFQDFAITEKMDDSIKREIAHCVEYR